jgi:hypothetical protein
LPLRRCLSTKLYFATARPGIPEDLGAVVSRWDKTGVKSELIEVETGAWAQEYEALLAGLLSSVTK